MKNVKNIYILLKQKHHQGKDFNKGASGMEMLTQVKFTKLLSNKIITPVYESIVNFNADIFNHFKAIIFER